MVKKILVPVDGSGHANKAVGFATELASKYNADIVLVHVVPHEPLPRELKEFAEVEHVPETIVPRELGERLLDSIAAQVMDQGGHEPTKDIREGHPANEILSCALDHGVDMIVMGTRGLGGLQELLMGSVSHKVTQLATCPCVTVR